MRWNLSNQFKKTQLLFGALAIVQLLAVSQASATGQRIVLRSGNGTPGERDSEIRCLPRPTITEESITEAAFAGARTAEYAHVVAPQRGWIHPIPADLEASWVAVDEKRSAISALYAIDFEINEDFAAARLDLYFAVDNHLGSGTTLGIYVNEQALPQEFRLGDHSAQSELHWNDIGAYLRPGRNTLYFYVYDLGVRAGLCFSAAIQLEGERPDICVEVSGPSVLRAATPVPISIRVCNQGERDREGVPVVVTVPKGYEIEPGFELSDGPEGLPPEEGGPGLTIEDEDRNQDIGVLIPYLSSGETTVLEVTLIPHQGTPVSDRVDVRVATGPSLWDAVDGTNACLNAYLQLGLETLFPVRCLSNAVSMGTQLRNAAYERDKLYGLWIVVSKTIGAFPSCASETLQTRLKAITVFSKGIKAAGQADAIWRLAEVCDQATKTNGAYLRTLLVNSLDPNEIVGELGSGVLKAVRAGERLNYTIHFENLSRAEAPPDHIIAPAQVVTITAALDPNLFDMESIEFGSFGFGSVTESPAPESRGLETLIDLRPSQNLMLEVKGQRLGVDKLQWVFRSLDPQTMELTSDPLAGFLPPNDTAPEGDGAVSFSVSSRGVPTGTQLLAQASIVFDSNDPIETGIWTNVVDEIAPSSQILAVQPAVTPGSYAIEIQASDDLAGVEGVRVFVSTAEGGVLPVEFDGEDWLVELEPEGEYSIASEAVDGVGNLEDRSAKEPFVFATLRPGSYALQAPMPNPAISATRIQFELPRTGSVELAVFDQRGRRIRVLRTGTIDAGVHVAAWNGRDSSGARVASGVYFLRLQGEHAVVTRKLAWVR